MIPPLSWIINPNAVSGITNIPYSITLQNNVDGCEFSNLLILILSCLCSLKDFLCTRVVCTFIGDDNSLRFSKDFECLKLGRCDSGNRLWLYRGKLHRTLHTAFHQ